MSTANGSGRCCSSDELKFASRFVRALRKMRRSTSSSSPSSIGMRKRSERIKRAAYRCMARAVGSRRAWSRSILFKLRTPSSHHSMMMKMRRKSSIIKSKKIKTISTTNSNSVCDDITSEVKKLRKVVPGGKGMDICSLLEETADFVTCLHTQLSIMQAIAHHFSNSHR